MSAKPLKIAMTGGGSGGHITPILAIAHEVKKLRPEVRIVYIGQRGDSLGDIPSRDKNIDTVVTVRAGKFRRYHGQGLLRTLLDVSTILKNIRDMFWAMVGIWQSFQLLKRLRPEVVFVKGGFVGVPVGLAAAMLHIPYVTHDSDALPGLANRLIAKWARLHTVALPKEVYAYPSHKTVTVGVPISHTFRPLSDREVATCRKQLGLEGGGPVLLITGGGNGARSLNIAVADCVPELLVRYPDLRVVHITGLSLEASMRQHYKQHVAPKLQPQVMVKGHITNMYQYSGVANVIVTRAGATSIAEFAAQAKACVVVPNPVLTGGHQIKNAQALADRKAVRMVSEDTLTEDHHALMPALTELLDDPAKAKALGSKLAALAQPDAARVVARLLLEVVDKKV